MKRQKFFYMKLMNLFGCFLLASDTKAPSAVIPISSSLTEKFKYETILKTECRQKAGDYVYT